MNIKISGRTICVIVAGVGMIATAWFAAKNAPDAQKKKDEALQAKREATGDENAQLTVVESVKAQIGSYIPAIISGTVALGSLVGSEVINADNLKKAEKSFNDYKEMADRIGGKGSSQIIEKAVEQKKLDTKSNKPWNKKETFRVVFEGQTIEFESTREDVLTAFYEANRRFQTKGILTFNEFMDILDQQILNDEVFRKGNERGWEAYVGEAVYGYTWIDFSLQPVEDEPWITEIYFPIYPHLFDEEEAYTEIEKTCGIESPTVYCIKLPDVKEKAESEHPKE